MQSKNNVTIKYYLFRLFILIIGLIIAHLGVTLFLITELGSDPYNVLIQGLYRTLSVATGFPLTHGLTHIIVSFIIIILLLFWDKTYIKTGTLICMILGGPIIDFFSNLIVPFQLHLLSMSVRIAFLSVGCIILAFGMTIVINSEAGTGPNDLVAIVVSNKLKIRFSIIRIIVDATFVFTGFLLGGVFGVGTIICVFLVGPIAGLFLPITKKMIQNITPGSFLS